jgi:hypothetical protein
LWSRAPPLRLPPAGELRTAPHAGERHRTCARRGLRRCSRSRRRR